MADNSWTITNTGRVLAGLYFLLDLGWPEAEVFRAVYAKCMEYLQDDLLPREDYELCSRFPGGDLLESVCSPDKDYHPNVWLN
jgi:hypothetical protein